ncbi:nitronate monooxygenase family protein [Geomonas sp. Red69]|uniref:Nitronate monooxygenase family protein n=1 Tax=Geomonas diazotrophica TaxID=2843197 RepID=A0ABX8JHU1_9BACT|nr:MULTISPECIES: nitronate monooxygenase family protein [Geomonas]MBU5637680.1 nitronate monooxygenase family protein [Geomonas diazotrophica]QWV96219.1 nitronate monooxygenase family protein [Geomonas nitrogeniifigens]QXE85286.1 nitronate monooxygenase family protein [Geomonas nitrogeniifigens]
MFKPLRIGKHEARYPLIQGGMGVRISAGSLAGHVAKCGGVGLVASPGITLNSEFFNGKNYLKSNCLALKEEIRKAYEIAPDGIIGVNVMVALSDFEELVAASVEAGAKVLVCGAGLPMTLPGLTAHAPDVALVPIVSSVRAAQLIAKKWDKAYNRLPDAVVVEDPDTAGGHLGEKMENIGTGEYDQYETVRGVKAFFLSEYGLDIPIIAAGGIWDRADLLHALAEGADGVQMASRFVTTVECDAEDAFKQAYLDCKKEDIGLIMSPAGLPGRAILTNQEGIMAYDRDHASACSYGCLKKCSFKESGERFCIVKSLDRAQRGEVDSGLIFCGTNAWKATRMETVQEIFDELFAEVAAVAEDQAA